MAFPRCKDFATAGMALLWWTQVPCKEAEDLPKRIAIRARAEERNGKEWPRAGELLVNCDNVGNAPTLRKAQSAKKRKFSGHARTGRAEGGILDAFLLAAFFAGLGRF